VEDLRQSFERAKEDDTRDFFSTVEPNASSVVVWITVGETSILLGGDLEVQSDATRGWTAVIGAEMRDGARATLVKIPHHGSTNAYDAEMWIQMLVENPIAVLSPFIWGRHGLPNTTERAVICAHTDRAFITHDQSATARIDPTVQQTLSEAAAEFAVLEVEPGHVRARGVGTDPSSWQVELFPPAAALCT
jgi:hypothetical protein